MEKRREAEELGKILVIAEKPSVARDIAKVLKAGQKGDGCLIGRVCCFLGNRAFGDTGRAGGLR